MEISTTISNEKMIYKITSSFFPDSWSAFNWYNLSLAWIWFLSTASTAHQNMYNLANSSDSTSPFSIDNENNHFCKLKQVEVAVL